MYLNNDKITDVLIDRYRESLLNACPNHIVIDNLFNESKMNQVLDILRQAHLWKTQKHTYDALYVEHTQWINTSIDQRFVKRDVWQRDTTKANSAQKFLTYLRENEFMSVLSTIFNVQLTDMNVTKPEINSNYYRLGTTDFVEQHADDSPGREVCMLLYLNKNWNQHAGGELCFLGKQEKKPIHISPLYNRCVLFNPSSEGSEHWVKKLNAKHIDQYRYNVTSWYWSE